MIRVLLAVLIGGMAFVIAAIIRRRQPDAPTQGTHQLPTQIDRADFAQHTAPWIVVVFTSATCNTCADVLSKARAHNAVLIRHDESGNTINLVPLMHCVVNRELNMHNAYVRALDDKGF